LGNPRYALQFPVPVSNVSDTSFQFVPGAQTTYPAGVPPGIYSLVAQFTDPTGTTVLQSTNSLPIGLAATLSDQAQTATPNADGTFTVSVNFTPNVWEGQDVALSLSGTVPPIPPGTLFSATAPAQTFTGQNNSALGFIFPAELPAGPLLGRLEVDGVTSQVQVNWSAKPLPVFTGPMVTIPL
jgi:hypothetical protein